MYELNDVEVSAIVTAIADEVGKTTSAKQLCRDFGLDLVLKVEDKRLREAAFIYNWSLIESSCLAAGLAKQSLSVYKSAARKAAELTKSTGRGKKTLEAAFSDFVKSQAKRLEMTEQAIIEGLKEAFEAAEAEKAVDNK